jgi:hypothetical protein
MMPMADPLAALRSLAVRPAVDEALGPWLGWTTDEADRYAGDVGTQDGLDPDRLRGLLLLMATNLPDPSHAPLIAALTHRAAPAADGAAELRAAMSLIASWLSSMGPDGFVRIVAAHADYEATYAALRMAGIDVTDDEAERLVACMGDVREIDHCVVSLGSCDMVVEIASDRWIVGLLEAGRLLVVDTIPYGNGPDDGGREDEPAPDPSPRVLQDA